MGRVDQYRAELKRLTEWEPPAPPAPPAAPPYFVAAPPPSPPARSRAGLLIGAVSVVTLVVVVAIAIGVVFVGINVLKRPAHKGGPLVVSTSVKSTSGKAVFTDDFHDPGSGWTTNSLPSGTTFRYSADGYVVVAKGTLDHFASSPYKTPVSQIAIGVTATQSTDAPVGAGYGVSCRRGSDTSELRYDFVVTAAGEWTVDRRDGGVLTRPLILKRGASTARLGTAPLAVTGMCATLADQHTMRLVMFAGPDKIADITDSAIAVSDTGWQADLMVTSSEIHDSTVTVAHFEVRDLAR